MQILKKSYFAIPSVFVGFCRLHFIPFFFSIKSVGVVLRVALNSREEQRNNTATHCAHLKECTTAVGQRIHLSIREYSKTRSYIFPRKIRSRPIHHAAPSLPQKYKCKSL